MRILTWLTLGFGAACAWSVYLLSEAGMLVLAGLCAAVFLAAMLFGRRFTKVRALALIALGGCLGSLWYGLYRDMYLDVPGAMDGLTETVTVRTTDYSRDTAYGMSVEGVVTLENRNYTVLAYLDAGEDLSPGTTLSGSFRFRYTGPAGEDSGTYHSGKGIFLLAYQQDTLEITAGMPETLRGKAAVLRNRLETVLEDCFSGQTCAFAKALLLGNTRQLSYRTDTDLKISGIRHVAAVSGLHVSLLFSLLMALTFRKRLLSAVVGFPVLLLVAAVAGFTPSVNRACLMCGLMLLARLAEREYDGMTALSFAALVMLIGNPLTIASVSFQLSAASVAGIFLFSPRIRIWLQSRFDIPKGKSWKGRLIRWLCSSVSVSVSATVFTAPLCALYFGTVSLIGLVTNLLCLWLVSIIFSGLILVCGVYLLHGAAGRLLALPVAAMIRLVLLVSGALAKFPLAAVYTESIYVCFWLIFVYLLLAVFLFSRKKRPGILACCTCLSLCLVLLASCLEPMLDDTRVTILDVGQGQCILLQNGGKTFLVDCGGDSDAQAADLAAETLLSQGISRLDGVILTHMDADHAGGAALLLSRIGADVLFLPPVASELGAAFPDRAVFVKEDLEVTWGDGRMRIFDPDFPGKPNEMSLGILFDTEKCDILITGDRSAFGERLLLRSGALAKVDVLVAGHHGSKNSTCDELLRAVRPEIVCISAGAENPYGHPAPELLERLTQYGCSIYRTDMQGTITIRR